MNTPIRQHWREMEDNAAIGVRRPVTLPKLRFMDDDFTPPPAMYEDPAFRLDDYRRRKIT